MRVMGALLAALVAAPAALATAPTQVTCAALAGAMQGAGAGVVLQLPAGTCLTNVSITNTAPFTVEGATGGNPSVLEPSNTADPIITSAGGAFTLAGLTLSGATGSSAVSVSGEDSLTLAGDTFSGDTGSTPVNIANTSSTDTTVISRDKFSHDAGSLGGAVLLVTSGPAEITGNRFTSDSAIDGGAIALVETSLGSGKGAQVTGNTFGGSGAAGNTAVNAGGAVWSELRSGQPLTLSENTFEGNSVTATGGDAGQGGAVWVISGLGNSTAPLVTQSRNIFIDNSVDFTGTTAPMNPQPVGGGAEWIQGLTVRSIADRFTGNSAATADGLPPEGGAVGAYASSATPPAKQLPASFTAQDDLFDGNTTAAGGWGGSIYVGIAIPPPCTSNCPADGLTLDDSTVVGNHVAAVSGSEGGAIWGSPDDHLSVANSIVHGNTPRPEIFGFSSGGPRVRFSDVCAEAGGVPVPGGPAGNLCAAPRLTSSGAETPFSPTLDAGSNALVPAGLATDLAGHRRIRSCGVAPPAIVDMGAFEFEGVGAVRRCLDRTAPTMAIGAHSLVDKGGEAAVSLGCPLGQSVCDGTIKLVGPDGGLGSSHFHIDGGAVATVKVKLSSQAIAELGGTQSIEVKVEVADHDAAGRHASETRRRKLKLH
jgi:hypothetical protein